MIRKTGFNSIIIDFYYTKSIESTSASIRQRKEGIKYIFYVQFGWKIGDEGMQDISTKYRVPKFNYLFDLRVILAVCKALWINNFLSKIKISLN